MCRRSAGDYLSSGGLLVRVPTLPFLEISADNRRCRLLDIVCTTIIPFYPVGRTALPVVPPLFTRVNVPLYRTTKPLPMPIYPFATVLQILKLRSTPKLQRKVEYIIS